MTTNEILTLQLGHYSNFVGTHWWNIQESQFEYGDEKGTEKTEEIDHDILFREGVTGRGEITFTPRLVLAELKGGLGSLKADGILYGHDSSDCQVLTWDGDTYVYKQPSDKKNQFLMDLDDTSEVAEAITQNGTENKMNGSTCSSSYILEKDVRVWSDYLRTHLHPKSTVIVNSHYHQSDNDPFDLWSKGVGLKNIIDEFEERIRFYAEECDSMQGFHILADSHDGFAGLASSIVPYLRDEFPSKKLVTFPVSPAKFPDDSLVKSSKRNLSSGLLLSSLLEHSSLICPLSLHSNSTRQPINFPHLIYDASLSYHTSAILASALDTVTLNHRLKGHRGINLDQFCTDVTSASKNLVSLSLDMPVSSINNTAEKIGRFKDMSETFNAHFDLDSWACLTPHAVTDGKVVTDYYAQSTTLRGIKSQISNTIGEDSLQQYFDSRFYGCCNYAYMRQSLLKTSVPFPQFFDDRVDRDGSISKEVPKKWNDVTKVWESSLSSSVDPIGSHQSGMNGDARGSSKPVVVNSVPVLTNLRSSSNIANVLSYAARCLQQSLKRHSSFHDMESENLVSEIEKLQLIQEEYDAKQQSSSDSDEDF